MQLDSSQAKHGVSFVKVFFIAYVIIIFLSLLLNSILISDRQRRSFEIPTSNRYNNNKAFIPSR